MNIGEYSVKNKVVSWLFVIILVGGGITGFDKMGKLEDPAFTIKDAKIITYYPGASAIQVQEEVAYHIEDALQLLPQIKEIDKSIARPGVSDITVSFQDKYRAEDFPNIFDELRRKIQDMKHNLPPGAMDPIVVDDFGDVYGVYLSITGDGYSYRDLEDFTEQMKRQLVLVDGVSKVVVGGIQEEVVYVEISRAKLGELGLSLSHIVDTLATQNTVVQAGHVEVDGEYIRISPTGEFTSVKQMEDLLISSEDKKLIFLKDIAEVKRAYKEVPSKMVFSNGKPALTMGISMQSGRNVLEVGAKLKQRMDELQSTIPIGLEWHQIYNQPVEVDKSISGFIISVVQALVIVIIVLLFFMGLRTGLIIGAVLLITVAGTLWIMEMFAIELQRISLGALIIALGMLVDNAIVIAEGMLVRIQKGEDPVKAAGETVSKSIWPLLGGTIIGILAFSAIGLSQDSTGEFAGSLFYVILISLMLSWFTAISTTPMLCAMLLKPSKDDDVDPYGGKLFQMYRNFVGLAVRQRWVTLMIVVGVFVSALIGFGFVKKSFFPSSNTPMFFVDIWEIQGTDIRKTAEDTLQVSEFLREQPGVVATHSFVGGPPDRFTLVYTPADASAVYSQIIVKTETLQDIPQIWENVEAYMKENLAHTDPLIKSLRIGPGRDSKIEARFHGPDPTVLRNLSAKAEAILRADPESKEVRNDWRSPEKLIQPVFNEKVARTLGISREELADALNVAFEGKQVGMYREGIRLLPIYARSPDEERKEVGNIEDIQVWSPVLNTAIPVSQVVERFDTVWENTVVRSRDRMLTIIASANPTVELATPLFDRVRPKIEAIELPPGYSFSWGGEYEDSKNANEALAKSLPMGFLMMIITSILLFGKLRQPLIIWLTVPLAIIGITAGLLGFRGAFDFMAVLGALSLIGLLIKNAIVLIEEIDQQIDSGKEAYTAILDSAVSRMRPVMMAATTTILGMIPLLPDVFFVNMSITIMGGLAFATVLTLIVVPVLYAVFFKVPNPK